MCNRPYYSIRILQISSQNVFTPKHDTATLGCHVATSTPAILNLLVVGNKYAVRSAQCSSVLFQFAKLARSSRCHWWFVQMAMAIATQRCCCWQCARLKTVRTFLTPPHPSPRLNRETGIRAGEFSSAVSITGLEASGPTLEHVTGRESERAGKKSQPQRQWQMALTKAPLFDKDGIIDTWPQSQLEFLCRTTRA